MNKILILVILVIVTINCFGQSYYEKGYFIDNKNIRTDCLIKNSDWLRNPTQFKYKLSENGEIQEADIKYVKEFGIANYYKYIRANVNVDISPSELKNISTDKNPVWQNKQLFLKVLVEGEASLYYYFGSKIDDRFFYSCKDSVIKQLIYKEYLYDTDHTAYNDSFRIQLKKDVHCSFDSDIELANMTYTKSDLAKYFIDYNTCIDPTYKVPERKRSKGEFSLALAAGLAYSSLSVSNDDRTYVNTDFGGKFISTYSLELEYILPFNNGKWGVVLSPAYQSSFHNEKQDGFKSTTINFESVDLALGIKNYLFQNYNTKFFVDCSVNSLLNYCIDSKVGYKVNTSKDFSYLYMTEAYNPNFILGAGLEYKNLFVSLKYYTPQNILTRYFSWDSRYDKISFNIGYKILRIKGGKNRKD
ncbi:PorT family protein [Parabacteroides sp. FAFU027]|uniref:PorT family protein n=1 Tax=Parabacteroides sp. FAFU027 TaxID=2922715 RepID=UPI001FAF17A8|nr:PorT family protein [Parabacteroides sp. FAFU027]